MSKVKSYGKQLIYYMIIASSAGIILEPLTWIFDGMTFNGAYYLEYITNFMLFLAGPIVAGISLSYVDYYINKSKARVMKLLFFQQISIITLILLIINVFTPVYFYITSDTNSFRSGELIYLHHILIYVMYGYLLFVLIQNSKKLSPKDRLVLFLCFMLPNLAVLLQLIESRLYFAWTFMVLGIIGIYVFLESAPTDEDFLTKIYNRKSYEIHLEYLIQANEIFGIILIDLDRFIDINYTYGHKKGDEVLVGFAAIIKHKFKTYGLIARIGGDEFAVILHKDPGDMDTHMKEIKSTISYSMDKVISNLEFCYGYHRYDDKMTGDELYVAADKDLYIHKGRIRKNQKEPFKN
jgi:diguanylate cyclase (GGDEF)-like protein